ncbi:hypothetical protein Tco_1498045 [Tanacetum coccineum]
MGFPVGSIVWALEVYIGVAMAHSSWVQAEAESSRSYAQHLAEEKMALLVKVEQEFFSSAIVNADAPVIVF